MSQQRHREPSTSPIVTILVVAGPGIAIATVAGRPGIAWAAAAITIALANLASLLTARGGHRRLGPRRKAAQLPKTDRRQDQLGGRPSHRRGRRRPD
jgi:membrane protein implicated in regulation of membrane protease activity